MGPSLTAADLAKRITGTSAYAIAADVVVLIRTGEIAPGTRLPTVRLLAAELGVSPSTISTAWQTLRTRGVVAGRGRAGVVVTETAATPRPTRFEALAYTFDERQIDLAGFKPDRNLVPDIYQAIAATRNDATNLYTHRRIAPRLEAAVRRTWPYEPRSLMAVNAGYDALRLCLNTFVREGDWVLIENPSPPRLIDLVESTGARAFLLDRDDEGVLPSALEKGIALGPAAFILQVGVHNPLGSVMTPRRRDQLAKVVDGRSVLLIENDSIGALFDDRLNPIGPLSDGPHLYVRSYSKSHGPDLRLAVIEGAEEQIARVQAYFDFGARWVSRPLQDALAWMLDDPDTQQLLRHARETYDARREALREALRRRGVEAKPSTGFGFIIPVRDEEYAHRLLRAGGAAAYRGNPLYSVTKGSWLRISASQVALEDVDVAADLLSRAVR